MSSSEELSSMEERVTHTLSIDIGTRHLGYSLLTKDGLSFDIFDIDETADKHPKLKRVNSAPVQRSFVLNEFLSDIIEKHGIEQIIVERQVPTNTKAMEIMYSIISLCITKIPLEKLIIYDPKKKFTDLKQKYETKGKAHKKLAIKLCRDELAKNYSHLLENFDRHPKKDDISDSVLMNLLTNGKMGK